MKKFFSFFICFSLLFSASFIKVNSSYNYKNLTEYPVIVVPGYCSSLLYCLEEDGTKDQVWGIKVGEVFHRLTVRFSDISKALKLAIKGDGNILGDTLGPEFLRIVERLRCNEDGTSVYNLSNYFFDASQTNSAYYRKMGLPSVFQHELGIMEEVAKHIGYENVFNFNCDFRYGITITAKRLNDYVKSVKEYTGAEKVNIISISHGGQITGTYLSLYGEENDVHNVVMTVPALGGAGIAYDLFNGNFKFDEDMLMEYIEYGAKFEVDYNWLTKNNFFEFLDGFLNTFGDYAREIMLKWGSMWDFLPTRYYEEMKAKYLDEEKNAAIIEESDYVHYEIMPNYHKAFARCQELGMNISILVGTGYSVITGMQENSDTIIPTWSSTGAVCAPIGSSFSVNYKQKVESDKNYISPSRTIDASTAYLPDNTWFVEDMYHGMMYSDDYAAELMYTLLLTDEIQSVWDNPDFPQFHDAVSPSLAVYSEFNNSKQGYLTFDDSALSITNTCKKHSVIILSVECEGADIDFETKIKKLKPGEKTEIHFDGVLPDNILSVCSVTVTYFEPGSPTPLGTRTQNFTVINGEPVEYTGDEYVSVSAEYEIDSVVSQRMSELLDKSGFKPLAETVYKLYKKYKYFV